MFRQQQQQPPQLQPQAPQNPTTQAPATQGFDFQRLLAVVNAQQQVQQPQVSQPQVMPQSQPSQPGVAPNVAAIISQFANQNQQSGANHAQQPSQVYEDPERKRMREENGYDSPYDDQSNQAKRSKQVGLTKHVSCSWNRPLGETTSDANPPRSPKLDWFLADTGARDDASRATNAPSGTTLGDFSFPYPHPTPLLGNESFRVYNRSTYPRCHVLALMDRGAPLASTGVIIYRHCSSSALSFRQTIDGVVFPGEASCSL